MSDLINNCMTSKEGEILPNIADFVNKTVNHYINSKIESYVYLHGAIEVMLFSIWALFLAKTLGKDLKPLNVFWDFSESIELLLQLNLINKTHKSSLLAFKKGRDTLGHLMTNQFRSKKISDKALDDQFSKGVKVFKELNKIRLKMEKEIDPTAMKILKTQTLENFQKRE